MATNTNDAAKDMDSSDATHINIKHRPVRQAMAGVGASVKGWRAAWKGGIVPSKFREIQQRSSGVHLHMGSGQWP
jgi:hypothetical protein